MPLYPSTWNNSAHNRQIFVNLYWEFLPKSVKKIQVWLKLDENNKDSTGRPMYTYDCKILFPVDTVSW